MPKDYFCSKILDTGFPCGERDVSKFIEGRYSTCRQCRLRSMSDYNKTKTEKCKEDKTKKIDPDKDIRWLIEDTFLRVPLLSNQTIKERMESNEYDVSDLLEKHFDYAETTNKKIENLENKLENAYKIIEMFKILLPEDKLEKFENLFSNH
jgi:cyclopropane fatty-acyl-phospholipid synthase-like methyltransferase